MPAERALGGPLGRAQRIHLVGIGGSGMASLAALLAGMGRLVSGSDLSPAAERLTSLGISTAVGHRADQLGAAELVIASAAIAADNPELAEAHRRGLLVLSHAQALGALMRERVGLAVAGTHGKTTTTAMLGVILERAGLDPTVLVGATALNFGSGARLGRGEHIVVEADEYDRRFLELSPWLALITSLEADHLDYFRDLEEIAQAFDGFVERVAPDGVVVSCADDPRLESRNFQRRRVRYGFAAAADWRITRFAPWEGGGCRFELWSDGRRTLVALPLNGRHNANNAAGAIASAAQVGVAPGLAAEALGAFRGTERRFQTLRRADGIWIVDDYAHHPTAVRATLEAAREVHPGRVWAVFQPHTTNRVARLFDQFVESFAAADRLTLLPIYRPAGREQGERSVSSADLARAICRPPCELATSLEQAEQQLVSEVRGGDLVVVMGAGDVTLLAHRLAERLAAGGGVAWGSR